MVTDGNSTPARAPTGSRAFACPVGARVNVDADCPLNADPVCPPLSPITLSADRWGGCPRIAGEARGTQLLRLGLGRRPEQPRPPFLLEPVALALDVIRRRVLQEPVEDRRGEDVVLEDLSPVEEALVAGNHQAWRARSGALGVSPFALQVAGLRT